MNNIYFYIIVYSLSHFKEIFFCVDIIYGRSKIIELKFINHGNRRVQTFLIGVVMMLLMNNELCTHQKTMCIFTKN